MATDSYPSSDVAPPPASAAATPAEQPAASAADPHEPVLHPVLNPQWALTVYHLGATLFFSVLLLVVNLLPLRSTDLWSHVDLGRWIIAHRQLPTQDPFQPLAEGMPLVDTAWLAQVSLATIEHYVGAEGLSNAFALLTMLTYLLLARSFYLLTGRLGLSVCGAIVVLAVGWSRVSTLRPEVFSSLCFATLIWLLVRGTRNHSNEESDQPSDLTGAPPSRLLWFVLPVLFAVWANLHGSFVVGLMLLGCLTAGRAIETLWATRSLRATLADKGVQQWTWLTELSLAATLVNPYGMGLWLEIAQFGKNRILESILEWLPLAILGPGGREFAVAFLGLLLVWRHSRRRVQVAEVLMLAVFGWMAVEHNRCVGWFAPVYALVLVPHVADLLKRWWPMKAVETAPLTVGQLPRGRSWRYSLLCLCVAWLAFAFSGMSRPLLGGAARSPASLYGDDTPLGLTEYLRKNPPTGQIYNPQWLGDWLVWDGPAGLKPFATTHMHLLPWTVWADHQRVHFAENGWDSVFDRYNIQTIIVDKKNQTTLAKVMRRQLAWKIRYEDEQAIVFGKGPLTPPKTDNPAPTPEQAAAR